MMDSKNPTAKALPGKSKERRPYAKAPLELDLPQALDALGKIAQEGKALQESKLAIVLGNTVTSSAFTRKVRALCVYGLLTEHPDELFTLTELALAIALPRSPQTQLEAKKQAFLNVEQFAFLFNQHKGKLLPADEFLRNILEQECGIPRESSQVWAKQFKDGARAAGLFHSRGDGKTQIVESPVSVEVAAQQPIEPPEDSARAGGDVSQGLIGLRSIEPQPSWAVAASGHCTRIDLSGGRRAEICIPDGLSAKDAQKLQKALDGIKVIIESMVSEV